MEESAFNALAEKTLAAIEAGLENSGADVDFELGAGGVLEVEFADGSKMIINRHGAAREIWVAARSGGFHFRPDNGNWIDTRDGSELFAKLERLLAEQAGEPVPLR
ncbi:MULTISPECIES: iron donor protein CyaY [Azospira]|uniref:Iron-sulfur cluster assembly protein CyaY n=1 Tax=Azospira oryzae (strain ATCC BAA-33 / DSM 13638 / PS) TaxID=640081 RepID=G8QKY1_AZOOP|nr:MULTISPECIES: iron donor protein CyaY [Azospira]AEV25586.1 iron donor protein CyaY [Azospira oryzae PS]MDK9690836.1 iron donor protein CyaY [Azospira sp.]TLS17008.1 MAG: iron donor protein CyaY [Betaproteobacteria bacterium]